MNEQRRGGSHKGLLLLIPAAVIIAKGASRRRAMWKSGTDPAGFAGHGHGHPYRFGGRGGRVDENGTFRLPPKIEAMLESWHTRAHQTDVSAEPTTV